MNKKFWKSTTFWGAVMIFVGGGLEAIGVTGSAEIMAQVCALLGLPVMGFGIRKAMK